MTRSRLKLAAILTCCAAVLLCGAFAAQADAHGRPYSRHHWSQGFYAHHAVVTGKVLTVSDGSFTADAHVVVPGAGDYQIPSDQNVTITVGSSTRLKLFGQSAINVGDTFYAVYRGESSSAGLTAIVAGTPNKIIAYSAPSPEVEVSGVITATPTTYNPDQFTASAAIVVPLRPWAPSSGPFSPGWMPTCGYGGYGGYGGDGGYGDDGGGYGGDGGGGGYGGGGGGGYGGWCCGGNGGGSSGNPYGGGYTYGDGVDGGYGTTGTYTDPGGDGSSYGSTTYGQGTPGTVITVSGTTTFSVNGDQQVTVANLAVGDHFVAIFAGTPNESLSQITSTPALSVSVRAHPELFGFVGTVVKTDRSADPATVKVNVAASNPSGFFSGDETFSVGQSTWIFGDNGSFGSLRAVADGDIVAGGALGWQGESLSQVLATPLGILLSFPASSGTYSGGGSGGSYYGLHKLRDHKFRAHALKKAEKFLRKQERARHHSKHQ